MRRALQWGLGLSVLLSIVAIWRGEPARAVDAVAPRIAERERALAEVQRSVPVALASATVLPETFERKLLEPAGRDVLRAVTPPAPPQVVAPVVAIVPPPPPATHSKPDMPYRFFGRMVSPSGEQQLYLSLADRAVPIQKGDRLDNGYVVEDITEQAVRVFHADAQYRTDIPIPATP